MKVQMHLNWKYVLVTLIVVAGCVSTYLFLQWRADQPVYDYLQVGRGELKVTLRESGVVEPEHRLQVTPPISGRVDSVEVANGESVKQGQVLAWLSSTDRAALIDAARAAGPKEYDFWKDIYKPAPLLAPLDGRIISTAVVPGEVVVAAQVTFVMSDHLIVQANVDETDLDQIWKDQTVEITLDGFPDAAHLTGKVHEIAYDATTVNNVTTYLVNIFLDQTPDYVVSGLTANVFFLVSDRPNVLRIPTDAITPEGNVLVAQAKDAAPVSQPIKTGSSDGYWTEVVSGLNEGDWVARPQFKVTSADTSGFSFTPKMPGGKTSNLAPPKPGPGH